MYEDGNVYVQLKTAQRTMPQRTYNILQSLHSQAKVDVLSEISPLYYNRLQISPLILGMHAVCCIISVRYSPVLDETHTVAIPD